MAVEPGKPRWSEADWKMRARVEDVDEVLDNALDLLEDSKRCKSVGAVALAVLSLEQASLAALLWGRTLLDRHGVTSSLSRNEVYLPLSPHLPVAVSVLVEEVAEFTDGHIKDVSKRHPPSLQHVETILRFMQRIAPYVFGPDGFRRVERRALSLRLRLRIWLGGRGRFVRDGSRELGELIAKTRLLGIPTLDKQKNAVLYAQVDRATGRVSLADIDEDQLEAVQELSGLIQDLIVNALNAAEFADERAEKVADRIMFIRRVEAATRVKLLPPELSVEETVTRAGNP